ncbi:MAG: hypothetical protein ABJR23_09175 [Paracoccaceae bacterium]
MPRRAAVHFPELVTAVPAGLAVGIAVGIIVAWRGVAWSGVECCGPRRDVP